ncbi:MAG: hypothetical protein LBB51_06945 [Zoogloeaceae bacterium]|jgi:hypothetical protein|nr:hypothetical protein [Zoogloeaceae bacterium]
MSSLFRILGIVLIMLIVGVSYSQREPESESARAQKNAAVESLQQEINRLREAALADDPRPIDAPSTQPVAQGDFGEMERIMREALAEDVAIANRYLQMLETIGWMSLLDAERLAADVDMAQSRAILERARVAIDTTEKEGDEYIRNREQRIQQANMSEKFREDMLRGAHKGLRRGNEARAKLWALERQMVDECERIIDLLSEREIWTLDDGEISFYNESDIDIYNESLEKIDDIVRQQQQIQNQLLGKVNDSLESMKR